MESDEFCKYRATVRKTRLPGVGRRVANARAQITINPTVAIITLFFYYYYIFLVFFIIVVDLVDTFDGTVQPQP